MEERVREWSGGGESGGEEGENIMSITTHMDTYIVHICHQKGEEEIEEEGEGQEDEERGENEGWWWEREGVGEERVG